MNRKSKWLYSLATLTMAGGFLLAFVSCDNFSVTERNHPLFIKAKNYKNNNRYTEAAKTFEEYLLLNPKSARTHQELANLYHDHLNDPLLAVYYYRQYLKYLPSAKKEDVATVSLWMQNAEKEYYNQLKDKFDDQAEAAALKKETIHLRDQNDKFKRYLRQLIIQNRRLSGMLSSQNKVIHAELDENTEEPDRVSVPSPRESVPASVSEHKASASAPEQPAYTDAKGKKYYHYVVKDGDSLSKISTRFYGNPAQADLIYDANKEALPSRSQIRTGQKLVIPVLTETQRKE